MRATLAVLAVVTGLAMAPEPARAQDRGGHPPGGQPPPAPSTPAPGRFGGVAPPAPNQPPVRVAPRVSTMRVSRPLPGPVSGFRTGLALYGWQYWAVESYAPPMITEVLHTPLTDDAAPTGGLQLDIEPRSAKVYVDGSYVGIVESFSGYFHHLTLPGGPHRIQMLAPAYEPLTLDVAVIPDRTTTYRNALARAPFGR